MRVYKRAFDWDEAKRMREAGMSWRVIADELGVSTGAVRRVVVLGLREQMNEASRQWNSEHRPWVGACTDCGGPATLIRNQPLRKGRCRACAALAATKTVRSDSLLCTGCGEWKPDDAFPVANGKIARRRRQAFCRPCQNEAKRAWRAANPGVEAATQRAYRRRDRVPA